MTTLKEYTQEKHNEAENTPFSKVLVAGELNQNMWSKLAEQKYFIYKVLEEKVPELPDDLRVAKKLMLDANTEQLTMMPETASYVDHLINLDAEQIMAHVYVHLMGDLYGGQILRQKMLHPNKTHLSFENRKENIAWIRKQLAGKDDSLAKEANLGFDAIIGIQNAIFENS